MSTERVGTRHRGELRVRDRVGVPGALDPRLPTVRDSIPSHVAAFLAYEPLVALSAAGPDGHVWTTAWSGGPGFISAADHRTLRIEGAQGLEADPVAAVLVPGVEVGLAVVDFPRRARVRINGRVLSFNGGRLDVTTDQVYGNCPKYIQAREPRLTSSRLADPPTSGSSYGTRLTRQQAERLGRADTFFLGTAVPGTGADTSHRGGMPGFLRVRDAANLAWLDYPGNRMFMSLGNLELNPRAGIVVPGWDDGSLLHLSGHAEVVWQEDPAGGPELRWIELAVERTLDRPAVLPLRWRFLEYSPSNPC